MPHGTQTSRRLRSFQGAVCACALLLWAAGALASPIACGDQPIRLAFYEYGYFYYSDKPGPAGIDKDIVEELTRRSGCRFSTQVLARARIWAELANGGLDMSVSGIQTPERDRFAWFAHYLSMKNYAVLGPSVPPAVQSAHGFLQHSKLQFGAVRAFRHGTRQDQWLDQLRADNRVQDSANVETLFKKLKEGRIDALFSQPAVYGKSLADLGLQHSTSIQDWTADEKGVPHGLILAKSRFSADDAKAWQALVATLRADGTLRRIYARYLSAAEASALLDF
jgi:polar amino acid transport system substrate-binding protein